ncbi:MAG: Si-specific NAD(P)(+) transhydrogenase [candidate division Zixibacteria bacterium]|nr:Si-specific NAD(P)(+) transhydrogenase [candidate division Zixibacteria bacterium]
MRTYDVIVIGSGPAGHHAAIQSAKLGKSTAVIERRQTIGGVALNAGTIPSKTLREAIMYLTGFRQRGLYGSSYRVKDKITFKDLTYRVDHVVEHELDVFRSHFQRNGVDIIAGDASFKDPHTLTVRSADGSDENVSGAAIIIATGTRPARPDHVPFDGEDIFDTDEMWKIKDEYLPKTLTVVGGGVIGIEYASALAAVGVQITVIERRPRILEFVDDEIIDALCYHLRAMRTVLRLGEEVTSVTRNNKGQVVATLASNKTIVSEALLYAVGRQGNTTTLNLGAAGLEADKRGRIEVDALYRTKVTHIFAAGDVIGFPSLASTSMEQGRLAANYAQDRECTSLPHLFPYGIYTIPEISYVGRNERELTEAKVPYEMGIAPYREIARGQIIGDETGMLKLLFHQKTRELLGVHIIGEGAAELIHIGQMVLTHGGTIDAFVDTVFNYPTLAECYKVAALAGTNKLASTDGIPEPPA